jgi:hypothetical protein
MCLLSRLNDEMERVNELFRSPEDEGEAFLGLDGELGLAKGRRVDGGEEKKTRIRNR